MRRTNIWFVLFCIQVTFIPILQVTFLGIQNCNCVAETLVGHVNGSAGYLTILFFTVSLLSGFHGTHDEFDSVGRHGSSADVEDGRGTRRGRLQCADQRAGQHGRAEGRPGGLRQSLRAGVATWPGAGCDHLQRTGRCFDQ